MILPQNEAAPILSVACADFLSEGSARIRELVDCFGSPLHIVFPNQAVKNALAWVSKLSSVHPQIKVQFAFKACKSISLAQAIAGEGVGADVSSVEEFVAALRCGFAASEISITGPDKPGDLLDLGIMHGAAIHVDSKDELDRVLGMQRARGRKTAIFIRMLSRTDSRSRFGIDRGAVLRCLGTLTNHEYSSAGLSFHLNGYSVDDRVAALMDAVAVAREAGVDGCRINSIDIGGGFPVRYLKDHSIESYAAGTHLSGAAQISGYPYAAPVASYDHAHAIIEKTLQSDTCRGFFRDSQVEIRFQPGRSLVENCGLTLMRVAAVKPKDENGAFVVLEGMSFSVSERWFGSDFAPTPLLLNDSSASNEMLRDYYLVGQSCLESDVIRNKAVRWTKQPSPGDLVCFSNTAGYQMDSNESPFHMRPLPKKIAVLKSDSSWKVHQDSNCNVRVSEK